MFILDHILSSFVKPREARQAKSFLTGLKERAVILPETAPNLQELQQLADSLIPAPRKPPVFDVLPEFTPDYEQLWSDGRGWPVFEYGQFKHEMPLHKRLDAEFLTPAFTVHKCPMWTKNNCEETFPIGTKCHVPGFAVPRSRISGELYLVPTQGIPYLDTYYRNGVDFERKNVKLIIPRLNERGNPTELRAFMYIGKKSRWAPEIDWNMNFYRGDGNISSIKPDRSDGSQQWLSWHTNFTKDNFKEDKDNECFMHITNEWNPGRQLKAA